MTTHQLSEGAVSAREAARRDDGKFGASAQPESDVVLSTAAGADESTEELRQAARKALAGFDTGSVGARGETSMRGLRDSMRDALEHDSLPSGAVGFQMAAACRREGVGLSDEDAHTMMRGIAPCLTDREVQTSSELIGASLSRAEQLLSGAGNPGDHPDDARVVDAYHSRAGAMPGADGQVEGGLAWMDRASYESVRAVAVSRERENPRVTIEAAPVPDDPDFVEDMVDWNDPGARARLRERIRLANLGEEAVYERLPDDGEVDDVKLEDLSPSAITGTDAYRDVRSVLVQRGLHPDEASGHAAEITRAAALGRYLSERGADGVDDADKYDDDRRGDPTHERTVLIPQSEVVDHLDVPVGDDPAEGRHWAAANGELWDDMAQERARTALGHPAYYRRS